MAEKKRVITLEFDEDRLTFGDLLALDEGESIREKMDVLCKFVKNGTGEFLEPEEGFELLKQFTIGELKAASEDFRKAAQGKDDPK